MKGPVTHEFRCDCADCEADQARRVAIRDAERAVVEAAKEVVALKDERCAMLWDEPPSNIIAWESRLRCAEGQLEAAVRKLNALEAK